MVSLQPRKQESFMFSAYLLLCFNAAVALYLMRGWLNRSCFRQSHELQGVIKKYSFVLALISLQPQASQSLLFRNFTFSVVVTSALIPISRILALWHYYHAPLTLALNFQYNEIPFLLKVAGLLPIYPENMREEDLLLIFRQSNNST